MGMWLQPSWEWASSKGINFSPVIVDISARIYNKTFCTWYRQRSHPQQRIKHATINRRCFTSCYSRSAVSHWRGYLWNLLSYGCGRSGDGGEVLGVSRRHRHGANDAISLRVLMGKSYALLRMRTLSISNAEGSLWSAARTNVVFTNSYVDNNSSLVSD
jgi:hypothetical protein